MDVDGESGIRGASGGSLASFALVKDFWRSLMDLENVALVLALLWRQLLVLVVLVLRWSKWDIRGAAFSESMS